MDNLTDLELEEAIADLEGTAVHNCLAGGRSFPSYLQWQLLGPLIKKYNVELQITKERDKVDASRGKYPKQYYAKIGRVEIMDKVIERAILLAIIEAHKE